mmetsp:Transcript_15516/g.22122  ORF Transcript_15516/g.22122 Transcript_15516/m.22122 type:complete len:123 (+) Transcript_15516:441-809(+)
MAPLDVVCKIFQASTQLLLYVEAEKRLLSCEFFKLSFPSLSLRLLDVHLLQIKSQTYSALRDLGRKVELPRLMQCTLYFLGNSILRQALDKRLNRIKDTIKEAQAKKFLEHMRVGGKTMPFI